MTVIEVKDLGTGLESLLARVRAGEEVLLTEAGDPVAKLLPVGGSPRRAGHGMFKGQVRVADDFHAPLTDEELKEWGL